MSASHERELSLLRHPLRRLRRARLPAAAALVFITLWALGDIAPLPAMCGFALVLLAALIDGKTREFPATAKPQEERRTARPAESRLDAVLAALPDPVIALNGAEQVMALNREASALAPALLRGHQISLGVRVPEVLDALRRARATGSAQRAEYFQRVPVERWYEVVAVPLALAQVAPQVTPQVAPTSDLVLLTFHDRTALRRVEQMRADFVANASHELRTPLAALSGFIETLQGPARADTAARERFLAIMHTQAKRMARLIDDLLSLSRIELNAHLRPEKEIELVGIVREVVDGLQSLAGERAVEITIAAPGAPLRVLGERDELMRMCENLVENALKYAASGKRVEIALSRTGGGEGRRDGKSDCNEAEKAGEQATEKDSKKGSGRGEARIAVRDHGPGIAPEHLSRLTERFYRVDVAESREQGGTGLGLALVKHILTRHGGRLTIESTRGKGATFTACLPLSGRSEPAELSAAGA